MAESAIWPTWPFLFLFLEFTFSSTRSTRCKDFHSIGFKLAEAALSFIVDNIVPRPVNIPSAASNSKCSLMSYLTGTTDAALACDISIIANAFDFVVSAAALPCVSFITFDDRVDHL